MQKLYANKLQKPQKTRYAILLTETNEKIEHGTQWSCVDLSRLVGSEHYVVTKQFKKKRIKK